MTKLSEDERAEPRRGMKAITVHRPWSYAIAHLGKDVENRTRRTNYRGVLAIHGGKVWSTRGEDVIDRINGRIFRPDERESGHGIVAITTLADCHHASQCVDGETFCSPWAEDDAWHLVLAGVMPLAKPVPCRGALGLWTVPDDVARMVLGLALVTGPSVEETIK